MTKPKFTWLESDPLGCYRDCVQLCGKLNKRHFHCNSCEYKTTRLDNVKRHIPYHFLNTGKERQQTPDCMKMLCNEYFTKDCHANECRYRSKGETHFHCIICKKWSCNNKKGYKYRLGHLRSGHHIFFKDYHQTEDLSNPKSLKRIKRLQLLGLAKFLPGKCELITQQFCSEVNASSTESLPNTLHDSVSPSSSQMEDTSPCN